MLGNYKMVEQCHSTFTSSLCDREQSPYSGEEQAEVQRGDMSSPARAQSHHGIPQPQSARHPSLEISVPPQASPSRPSSLPTLVCRALWVLRTHGLVNSLPLGKNEPLLTCYFLTICIHEQTSNRASNRCLVSARFRGHVIKAPPPWSRCSDQGENTATNTEQHWKWSHRGLAQEQREHRCHRQRERGTTTVFTIRV